MYCVILALYFLLSNLGLFVVCRLMICNCHSRFEWQRVWGRWRKRSNAGSHRNTVYSWRCRFLWVYWQIPFCSAIVLSYVVKWRPKPFDQGYVSWPLS